jgi:hypothetical protein
MPASKRILNKMADVNFFLMTGSPYINSVSSGFRCYSKEAIKKIMLKLKGNAGYGIELETLKIAKELKMRIKEVPVTIDYNYGKKANFWKLFTGYLVFDIKCLKGKKAHS